MRPKRSLRFERLRLTAGGKGCMQSAVIVADRSVWFRVRLFVAGWTVQLVAGTLEQVPRTRGICA